MAKEYIDREAVNQIIAAQCGECADACLEFDGIQPDCNQCLLYGAKKAVDSIPSADVRPVVRGKLEKTDCAYCCGLTEDGDSIVLPTVRCSVCKKLIAPVIWKNFCPNCGADMREG